MSVSVAEGVVAVAPKKIIAGTNITTSETDSTITINSVASGGSTTGTTLLDFGSAPGTNIVSVNITGQTSILSTSKAKAYLMVDNTETHNAYEHIIVPIKFTCGNIIAGVGFTIYATTDWRITGTFNITWEWV